MLSQPRLVERAAQPYAGMAAAIRNPAVDYRKAADTLPRAIAAWLQAKGIAPIGPPFVRVVHAKGGDLDIEWAFPTAAPVPADGDIIAGTLPAGRYGEVVITGGYEEMPQAHAAVRAWAGQDGRSPDIRQGPDGVDFGGSFEVYVSDPTTTPHDQLRTEIFLRLA